jgi:hypothetical protein
LGASFKHRARFGIAATERVTTRCHTDRRDDQATGALNTTARLLRQAPTDDDIQRLVFSMSQQNTPPATPDTLPINTTRYRQQIWQAPADVDRTEIRIVALQAQRNDTRKDDRRNQRAARRYRSTLRLRTRHRRAVD